MLLHHAIRKGRCAQCCRRAVMTSARCGESDGGQLRSLQ
ncbi:hypothetical protein MMMB2_2978 [Mycobacterium marinum MB2]|nr:hypothetical protein MMMB2_2978 [Mycobacterium marinum MB2]